MVEHSFSRKVFLEGILFLVALSFSIQSGSQLAMAQNESQAEAKRQIDSAFEQARNGNLQAIAALAELPAASASLLRPYVHDESSALRREAISVLTALGGKEASPLLVEALSDPNAGNRERASSGLYFVYDPQEIVALDHAGPALRKAVRGHSVSATSVLLLRYFPGKETRQVLEQTRDNPQAGKTKLRSWSPVVPARLPALVSLSALGDTDSRNELLKLIDAADPAQLEFLFNAIREVDSPRVLHALKQCLQNQTQISAGVPAGATPRRRICDLAVDAFVKRLNLKVSFELAEHQRYEDDEIKEVIDGINKTLPR